MTWRCATRMTIACKSALQTVKLVCAAVAVTQISVCCLLFPWPVSWPRMCGAVWLGYPIWSCLRNAFNVFYTMQMCRWISAETLWFACRRRDSWVLSTRGSNRTTLNDWRPTLPSHTYFFLPFLPELKVSRCHNSLLPLLLGNGCVVKTAYETYRSLVACREAESPNRRGLHRFCDCFWVSWGALYFWLQALQGAQLSRLWRMDGPMCNPDQFWPNQTTTLGSVLVSLCRQPTPVFCSIWAPLIRPQTKPQEWWSWPARWGLPCGLFSSPPAPECWAHQPCALASLLAQSMGTFWTWPLSTWASCCLCSFSTLHCPACLSITDLTLSHLIIPQTFWSDREAQYHVVSVSPPRVAHPQIFEISYPKIPHWLSHAGSKSLVIFFFFFVWKHDTMLLNEVTCWTQTSYLPFCA